MNITHCILFPCYRKLKAPQRCECSVVNLEHLFVIQSLFLEFVRSLHDIFGEICLDIYRRLGHPYIEECLLTSFPKSLCSNACCNVKSWFIWLIYCSSVHKVLIQIEVIIILAVSLYLCKLLILFLQWDHVNRYV